MKKLFSILLICVICLVSCAKNENTLADNDYLNDVDVSVITQKLLETVNIPALTKADEGWVALNIPIDTSLCDECAVYIHTEGSSDMFGVFKASSTENAKKLLSDAESYLSTLEKNWMSEYLAEEFPKIENATAKRCGLYVTFLILDDNTRNSAESEFENVLKK
ncbi:MAG: DUF4358 domain-containing protein [Clostridia bacterium]|nr:DUF4358 domain-containing protein [Clostridia bacterium]